MGVRWSGVYVCVRERDCVGASCFCLCNVKLQLRAESEAGGIFSWWQ